MRIERDIFHSLILGKDRGSIFKILVEYLGIIPTKIEYLSHKSVK